MEKTAKGTIAANPKQQDENYPCRTTLFTTLFSVYPNELVKILPAHINAEKSIEVMMPYDVENRYVLNSVTLYANSTRLLFFDVQFTPNPNTPLIHFLSYNNACEQIYTRDKNYPYILPKKAPRPVFTGLYIGDEERPDSFTMKLSDAFMTKQDNPFIELKVVFININKGRNSDIVGRSEILGGYVELIDKMKRHAREGLDRTDAIKKAVGECISEGIFKEFLTSHADGVEDLLLAEWDA